MPVNASATCNFAMQTTISKGVSPLRPKPAMRLNTMHIFQEGRSYVWVFFVYAAFFVGVGSLCQSAATFEWQ